MKVQNDSGVFQDNYINRRIVWMEKTVRIRKSFAPHRKYWCLVLLSAYHLSWGLSMCFSLFPKNTSVQRQQYSWGKNNSLYNNFFDFYMSRIAQRVHWQQNQYIMNSIADVIIQYINQDVDRFWFTDLSTLCLLIIVRVSFHLITTIMSKTKSNQKEHFAAKTQFGWYY